MLSKSIEVVIPDLCVGEMVQVVAEKKLEVDFEHLLREFRKGRLVMGHVKEEDLTLYSNLIPKIRKADQRLESSDIRILAFSMADRDCRGLMTFDRKLIESTGLRKFITREVTFKKEHLITDDPFGR